MRNKVVYLSHGGQQFHDQTRFSVLTLLARLLAEGRSDIAIAIYTDRPELAPKHELIKVAPLAVEDLRRWRGPLDYVHRVRLEILRRAVQDIGLPFIYVDSDTRWLKIPDPQFAALRPPGTDRERTDKPAFFMHTIEGEVSPTFFPQYYRFLRAREAQLKSSGLQTPRPWIMWNAGTLGVPPGADNFFSETLSLCDEFLPYVRSRNCLDQLIMSMLAASRFRIAALDDCVHHYWKFNSETAVVLRRILAKLDQQAVLERQAELSVRQEWDEAELRAIQKAPINRLRRLLRKTANSVHKRKLDLIARRLRHSQ